MWRWLHHKWHQQKQNMKNIQTHKRNGENIPPPRCLWYWSKLEYGNSNKMTKPRRSWKTSRMKGSMKSQQRPRQRQIKIRGKNRDVKSVLLLRFHCPTKWSPSYFILRSFAHHKAFKITLREQAFEWSGSIDTHTHRQRKSQTGKQTSRQTD